MLIVGVLAIDQPEAVRFGLLLPGLLLTGLGLIAGAGSQGLQRRADDTPGYQGPSPLLVFAAGLFLNLFALSLFALIARGPASETEAGPLITLLSVLVTLGFNLGLIRLLIVGPGALRWSEIGLRRPASDELVRETGRSVLLGAGTYVLTVVLALLLVGLLGVEPESPIPITLEPVGTILNLLSAVVVAPISEEIFFRGYATTAWARTIGPRRAVIRGALFFAFAHILAISSTSFSVGVRLAAIAFLARLPIAYVLGWTFLRRGSLYAAIVVHACFNGIPLLLVLLLQRVPATG